MALKMHDSLAVHAGEWLRAEIVEPAEVSTTDLAHHLGVSRQTLSALLNGKSGLSAPMAIKFEKAFGISAKALMKMQATYELAMARQDQVGASIERLASAG